MSNLVEISKDMQPVLGLKPFYIMKSQGFKIGFVGFAEEGWLGCLGSKNNTKDLKYLDFNQTLRKYSKILRDDYKCDMIIAINHMSLPDDRKMAIENNI
jgi:2',3'-cyclic-nucleotide 2'-phosphodiesterase (5'-nucleotidase family)